MTKYNGWANRETWLIGLWGLLEGIGHKVDADYVEELFNEYVETTSPELINGASLITDLFNGAVSAIDWHEIAAIHNLDIED